MAAVEECKVWKKQKYSRLMAIFGDASLIISIAASEVDLEAGD